MLSKAILICGSTLNLIKCGILNQVRLSFAIKFINLNIKFKFLNTELDFKNG